MKKILTTSKNFVFLTYKNKTRLLLLAQLILLFSCVNSTQKRNQKENFNKNLIGEWRLNSLGTNFTNTNDEINSQAQLFIPIFQKEEIKIDKNRNVLISSAFIGKLFCFSDSILIFNPNCKDEINHQIPINRMMNYKVTKKYIELRFEVKDQFGKIRFYLSLNKYKKNTLPTYEEEMSTAMNSIGN